MTAIDPAARRVTRKVVVLGPEGAGVRATVAALQAGAVVDADLTRPLLPSMAAVVDCVEVGGGVERLLVHAAPGAPALARTRRRVLAEASGLLLVLDMQRERLASQRAWMEALPGLVRDAALDPVRIPAVVLFNKCDLPTTLRADRAACEAACEVAAEFAGRPTLEASAVRGDGVRAAIDALMRLMHQAGAVVLVLLCALLFGSSPVLAQPAESNAGVPLRTWSEGRVVIFAGPAESRLAASLLAATRARPGLPGLPALRDTAWVWIAPDDATFRRWVGPSAPEWGAAIAFPARRVIVMQGRDAGGGAGDPVQTFRHELAHLALAEVLGPEVPRWFDEGYASFAAGEWGRDEVLTTSVGLVWRGVPTLAGLDSAFHGGADRAQRGYALAHRAVAELAALGGAAGLQRLFTAWRTAGSFDAALRAAHGLTIEGFEARFRSQVRRQYGVLALATDLGLLTLVIGVIVGPFWWRRRREAQARLARMRAFEAAQDAAERASALARLLGEAEGDMRTANPGS
ncbi:MAG: peptidase MA family metallohydrolase [Gemmatimonadaceae bacterium]